MLQALEISIDTLRLGYTLRARLGNRRISRLDKRFLLISFKQLPFPYNELIGLTVSINPYRITPFMVMPEHNTYLGRTIRINTIVNC